MLINIIGAGKLGQTIGYLLARLPDVSIGAICNKSLSSSQYAVNFIGYGYAIDKLKDLPNADITLIATKDEFIGKISTELCNLQKINPKSIVFHCSGLLNSSILEDVFKLGAYTASLHPMHSFAKPEKSILNFSGTYCAIEGCEQAVSLLASLFLKLDAYIYRVNGQNKANYHAAGVFASNYLITLAQKACQCLENADFNHQDAKKIVYSLMKGAVENINHVESLDEALTGPIQRGDLDTLKMHLDNLASNELKNIYKILGLSTLELTSHDENTINQLKELLN